jgi:hypothetical protein
MRCWHILLAFAMLWTQTQVTAQTSANGFLQSVVSNDTPYVGQAIHYALRIYDAGLPSGASLILPDFEGFLQTELPDNATPFLQVIDGVAYTVYTREILLYPVRAGDFVIAPALLNVPETPFNHAERYSSLALAVRVLPLPFNAPTSFENAVGTFTFNASATPTQLKVGESLSVVVTVSGVGNLEQLRFPPPALDADLWRVLTRTPTLRLTQPTEGEKRFEWTLIPKRDGEFRLPDLTFSFFSPQDGQYVVQTSPPIRITVGENAANNPSPDTPASLDLIWEPSPPLSPIAWWTWGIPPVLALLWHVLRTPKQRRERSAPLADPKKVKEDLQRFSRQPHDQAYLQLAQWLNAILEHPPQSLSLDEVQHLKHYITRAKEARYAPPSQESLRAFCQEVYQVVAPLFRK